MLYLDYAKPLADGKYILSFFADSVADLESISHGQKFVTKNGTDYGVPQAGSTVIVTSPNSGKTTYVMDAEGIWVVTEDISYSAVVANPSDAATAKLEKLKVNDTTYANWTENEIKSIASESGGGKLYIHTIPVKRETIDYGIVNILTSKKDKIVASEITNQDYYLVLNYYRYDTASNTHISVIGGHITEDHGQLSILGDISIQGIAGQSTDVNAVLSFAPIISFDAFNPTGYIIKEL